MSYGKQTQWANGDWAYAPVWKWWHRINPMAYKQAAEAYMTAQHERILRDITEIDAMHYWAGTTAQNMIAQFQQAKDAWDQVDGPNYPWASP